MTLQLRDWGSVPCEMPLRRRVCLNIPKSRPGQRTLWPLSNGQVHWACWRAALLFAGELVYHFSEPRCAACHIRVSISALLKGPGEGQDLTPNTLFIYITNCRNCSLISVFEMPCQTSEGIHNAGVPWTALTMVQCGFLMKLQVQGNAELEIYLMLQYS